MKAENKNPVAQRRRYDCDRLSSYIWNRLRRYDCNWQKARYADQNK
jgi:hypothetical protein